MRKKIAILGNPPLWQINPEIEHKGWYSCVWFMPLYEAFINLPQYEVHWVCLTHDVKWKKDFEAGNQYFHVLPCYSLNWGEKFRYVAAKYFVKRELERIQPDLVHAWGTESYYGICGRDWPGRKILSMQGLLVAYVQRAQMSPFAVKQSRYERDTVNAYDIITVESTWGLERLHELVPGKKVMRWEYAPQALFSRVERKLSAQPTCLMAGTPSPVKNLQTAIKAFSHPELAHVTLLIAGLAPGQIPDLPSNVKPLGGQSREQMAELMAQVWCLIHPSLADTSPNIVKEARVAGVPAVVSSECGGTQYVVHGESGYVIQPLDVDALVTAVSNLTRSQENSLKMGAFGLDECRRLLSPETMTERMMEIYEIALHDI